MELSNGFRRLFALCVLAVFLVFALVPVTSVIAGPGDDPVPVPGTPPPSGCVTGVDTEVTLTILGLVIDVVTAVAL